MENSPIRDCRFAICLSLVLCLTAMGGCNSEKSSSGAHRTSINPPLGLPPLSYPEENPPTAEAIDLGLRLFFDRRLSRDNTLSCATCHDPATAFADKRAVSRGVRGMSGVRNAPTLLNSAYLPVLFWDGRAVSLEQQSAGPMADPREMDQNHSVLVVRLNADPEYRELTRKAFGSPILTIGRVEKAIAGFERTLLSGDSPFDRYEFGGDRTALTPSQIRGLAVFKDPHRGNCVVCHTIEAHSALFTDGRFHNIGVGVKDDGAFADAGRYTQTLVTSDTGAFRTPTLRNVALTPPYMHDGSLATLKDVVDYYAGKGNSNPYLDKEMLKINLSNSDRADLVELLKALTGESPRQKNQTAFETSSIR